MAGDPSDKRTQIGTAPPSRQTGTAPAARPAASTPAPATGTPAPVAPGPGTGPVYVPPPDPLLGQTLAGRYQIVRKLGEGGMGAVYLAIHALLEKQVALKVLHGEFARKPDLVERFMQEAKAASRIRNENVIDISDFGVTPDGFVFFAMELLEGHDLHEEISRAKLAGVPMPWHRSRQIFLQVCSALSAAHSHGIIHRDLKPENIYLIEFLGNKDFVKLLDFGIAKLTEVAEGDRKLTRTGMLFGTPEYMSPEQARGDAVDHRVDIYAMGCILYQLVVGRVPFEAENFMGILSQHLTENAPPVEPAQLARIGAPVELGPIIAKALAKHRDERWSTIDDFANAIRALHGETQQPVADVRVPRAQSNVVAAQAQPGGTDRVRTKWTGNLHVPMEDAAPTAPPRRSLAPFIAAGVILVAGGAIAAYVMTRPPKTAAPGPGSGSLVASGSAAVTPGSGDIAGNGSATVTPPQPPPTPVPAMVKLRLTSKPKKATVYLLEPKGETRIGTTPIDYDVPGSHEAVRFAIRLKGYQDKVLQLVPDHTPIEWATDLEKGASSGTAKVEVVGPGAVTSPGDIKIKPPGTNVDKPPEVKPPEDKPPEVKPPEDKPPEVKPPPGDDDPDMIQLKPPERTGSGSGT